MRNADLDIYRALIRARSGMPPAPDRMPWGDQPSVANAAETAPRTRGDMAPPSGPVSAIRMVQTRPRAAPSQTAPVLDGSESPTAARFPTGFVAPPEGGADWAPDGVLHRLVELLMEMRGLTLPAKAEAAPGQPVAA